MKCERCNGSGTLHRCGGCGCLYRHIHKYSGCDNARCEGEPYTVASCPDCGGSGDVGGWRNSPPRESLAAHDAEVRAAAFAEAAAILERRVGELRNPPRLGEWNGNIRAVIASEIADLARLIREGT